MSYTIEHQIIGESRHQFIYGKKDLQQNSNLKNMELNYPVFVDRNEPMAVYVEDFSLPNISKTAEVDRILVERIAREYLNFTIATSIMERLLKNIDHSLLKKKEGKFIDKINKLYINEECNKVSSLEEVLQVLSSMKKFYKDLYIEYLQSGKLEINVLKLPIAFLMIDFFVRDVKKMLNSDSYFALIFNVENDMAVISQQAINNLISSRINSDMSIKVVCEQDAWKSYYNMQGQIVENVHDYGTVYYEGITEYYTRTRSLKDEK